jgi:hypothetical protein
MRINEFLKLNFRDLSNEEVAEELTELLFNRIEQDLGRQGFDERVPGISLGIANALLSYVEICLTT